MLFFMNMIRKAALSSTKSLIALAAISLVVSGCGSTNPTPYAGYRQPVVSYSAPKGPTQAESGSRPPAFDKNGNANYDANGNYIGGHGVGTLVDSPENSAPAPTSPSDLVRKDQADIDESMCKSMKAADPDAAC
ncbi:hypothetical protein EOC93_24910 [Mesorhizobium sp. M6A.T.Ce.TU.002.03.1.1]|uniref:hypothetical protein n=2 Tax=Mesorhizobium TaxID=68287 RepID=UPI000FCC0DBE|nr:MULTISPECIES: hypothetical protein [unclassified Mesorhizobium]RUU36774.1 hypothetical protein EOC93_24910 [Mesorhizobium sp. M6A.T.Ce.TU.002.03.1.1]RWP76360.1 MAG: hypothetical protein EOR09_11035 [Mesorhizobium sp.]RWQ66406.1 MAG: hypothetical protein EOS86_10485 [Mesorhizobium sp.]TIM50022.1 MAG: hypothetical protein E5Y69_07890 [Mesorhizobium sp.]